MIIDFHKSNTGLCLVIISCSLKVHDRQFMIYIDYYTAFLIPALISAWVDRISQSPKGEGWYCPRAGIKKAV